ncbi:MAG: hypothetical protein MMC33_000991 [Icmadophila ericetorum]|nr:hypothetical protein [Icmadophila ericetorum]
MRGRVFCLQICGPRLWLSRISRTRRSQHYSTVLTPKTETVQVFTGSNGSISLDIYYHSHPILPAHLLISLPRGLDLPSTSVANPEPINFSRLAQIAGTTVVRINYRLSAHVPYPTPIHDVLAGYDWIQKNLIRPNEYELPFRIGVYGELMGGSLAAMLGLTECSIIKRAAIRSVMVSNPITDWTAIHEGMMNSGGSSECDNSDGNGTLEGGNASASGFSVQALLETRSKIFRKPEAYFDQFASPLLFFRTPSSDLPSDAPSEEPPSGEAASPEWIKKRRSYRRHPPTVSALRLPRVRVEVGSGNILAEQGRELAAALKRSLGFNGRAGGGKRWEAFEEIHGFVKKDEVNVEEMGKAEVVEKDGLGLWTEDDLLRAGEWFREALRKP